MNSVMDNKMMPMLIPYEPKEFWDMIRKIVCEELEQLKVQRSHLLDTPGLTEKPLYKVAEICELFKISRPTVNEWARKGQLRKVKVGARVFFLGKDIDRILEGEKGAG